MNFQATLLVLSILLALRLQQASAADQPFLFHQITTKEGLSHTDANALAQDRNGYVWIGTYSGLDRFDGYRIKSFYNENDFINKSYLNRISDLTIDDNGLVWMAVFSGIQCFDPIREKYIQIHMDKGGSPACEVEIKKILAVDTAALFVITKEKTLFKYERRADTIVALADFDLNETSNSFQLDKHKRVWVATDNGMTILDRNGKKHRLRLKNPDGPGFLPVKSALINHRNQLLVASASNLFLFDCNVDGINRDSILTKSWKIGFPAENQVISDIVQERYGRYWISSDKGLFLLTGDGPPFSLHPLYAGAPNNNLNSDFVNQLLIDNGGNLHVATYSGGVNILNLNRKKFNVITQMPRNGRTLSGKIVRAIAENGKHLWVGTNSMGLNRVDLTTGEVRPFSSQSIDNRSIKSNNIRALAADGTGNLWVGHTHGIDILDDDGSRIVPIWKDNKDFPTVEVSSLAIDHFGQVWVGTWHQGIARIRKNKNGALEHVFFKVTNPDYPAFAHSRVTTIYADPNRTEILFATGESLVQLFLDQHGDIQKNFIYKADNRKNNTLSSNFICAIERESESVLWLGTIGGGLNRMELLPNGKYRAEHFSKNEGLNLYDVESLHLDEANDLWLGGNNLVKYDRTKNTFKEYVTHGEVYSNSYKVGASYRAENGMLFFGGTNGIVYFNPSEIEDNPILAVPDIAEIAVNNQFIEPGSSPMSAKGVPYMDSVTLSYRENNLVLYFASLQSVDPANCKFQYRLRGYEDRWYISKRGEQSASYANLPYGEYIFELKASNNDGIWNDRIRSLVIRITPPWWLSIWAKTAYVFVAVVALAAIYFYLARWINLKRKLEIQEIKEEQRERLHQLQIQFFTNISHEFRTPLTLMLGNLEQLEQDPKNSNLNARVAKLKKNVLRLIKLINELMDFRKAEKGGFRLQAQPEELGAFIKNIALDFNDLAINKGLRFRLNMNHVRDLAWFDPKIVEKITLNLLDNAFKYTKPGGEIEIQTMEEADAFSSPLANSHAIASDVEAKSYFHILVSDTGAGISRESITKVFERFYQIADSEHDPHLGSGVGLALVKSLVLLHKGRLTVWSERDKGTEFIVSIPRSKADYTETEQAAIPAAFIPSERVEASPDTELKHAEKLLPRADYAEKKTKPTLHIVEDNEEVRQFLREALEPTYHIQESVDGMEALELLKTGLPDLIVSDLMMPRMNGYELCRVVKNASQTCHLPIVLLTAKDDTQSEIDGIETGADVYLTKPVSINLLKSTLKNLLSQRRKITNFLHVHHLDLSIDNTLRNKNKIFYDALIKIIEDNIENTDLDIGLLCKHLPYSRTKLYQLVKEITGMPIMELVRSIRFKKAIRLMAEKDLPIQEIMIKVGIQSQSYFTRFFKKEFGKTPGQFAKELKNRSAVTYQPMEWNS